MRRAPAHRTPCRLEVDPLEVGRRDVLAALPMVCAGVVCADLVCADLVCGGADPAAAEPADERPRQGDLLVAAAKLDPAAPDGATFDALAPEDVTGPLIAWPMDASARLARTGSRLNKVLLLRLDPATLAGPTRERAAGGVVAYSAICPHAGCEVTGFAADSQVLECPCHNSKYDPRDAAAIVEGPTTRALAALPLTIADGKLAVARPFVGRLGIAPA